MNEPVLVATRSTGKLREIVPMLAAAGITAIDPMTAGIAESDAEDAIEVFDTFEENALAKAGYFHRLSGLVTVADDSGLEVDALGGAPGVHSKRWSGEHSADGARLDTANNVFLLQRLEGVERRSARFVCAAVLVDARGSLVTHGTVTGKVATSVRGSSGFGYDGCFIPDEGDGRTFGELPSSVKAQLSHRARAFWALMRAMQQRS